jgi:predicted DCC family thiol-disulfide oxidoreductase YuxK
VHKIILFDGICHLCSTSVKFIIKRDPHALFRFASLQSETGKALVKKFAIPEMDSLIFIDGDRYYAKSSAVLRVCKHLEGFWKWFYIFIFIPKPLRDRLYDWIAKHRYQWFGKRDSCLMPTPDVRMRFLDESMF